MWSCISHFWGINMCMRGIRSSIDIFSSCDVYKNYIFWLPLEANTTAFLNVFQDEDVQFSISTGLRHQLVCKIFFVISKQSYKPSSALPTHYTTMQRGARLGWKCCRAAYSRLIELSSLHPGSERTRPQCVFQFEPHVQYGSHRRFPLQAIYTTINRTY